MLITFIIALNLYFLDNIFFAPTDVTVQNLEIVLAITLVESIEEVGCKAI
jgi:hypothetical protein